MQNKISFLRCALMPFGLITLNGGLAVAQREPSDCASVATSLRQQPDVPSKAWAVLECPISGPAALAALWARPGTPSAARRSVGEVSGLLRDETLFGAVRGTAENGARSPEDRLLALRVLMQYINSHYDVPAEFLSGNFADNSVGRRVDGPVPVDGATPLPTGYRAQIGSVFARLAVSDLDVSVRHGSLMLRQVLARDDPADTPLQANAITLVAGCGSEITLRSVADVDIELELRVLGSTFAKTYGIRAGTTSKPMARTLVVPKGTVVAQFGGREVARLSQRNGKCAPGQVRW